MAWRTTHDVDEFLSIAGEFLRAEPAANTIILTTLDNLANRGPHAYGELDPRFGWWMAHGAVVGAFLHTPPHPPVLTVVPDDAVAPLVDELDGVRHVNADSGLAEAISELWLRRTGEKSEVQRRTRLYRLGELVPPDPGPPGTARLAEQADFDLLREWYRLFHEDMGEGVGDQPGTIIDRIGYGGLTLWEVDSVPVAMAGRTRPTSGMIRVGPVFTPVDRRQRGYAGAVTAAVSRDAQQLAGEVLLFTDLANPVSNSIYQRLGYRPVHDRWVITR
jgi:FR47-like protein